MIMIMMMMSQWFLLSELNKKFYFQKQLTFSRNSPVGNVLDMSIAKTFPTPQCH